MRHRVMDMIGSLRNAQSDQLEQAVDALISENEMSAHCFEVVEDIAMRAEALAILSHEFRRRSDAE